MSDQLEAGVFRFFKGVKIEANNRYFTNHWSWIANWGRTCLPILEAFFFWCLQGLPAWRIQWESIFVWLLFWVNIARKYIGKCYFSESLADVLWACSGGAAGVKMSEIPSCALQRATIWCNHLWQCSCYLPSCFLFGGHFPGIPALVPKWLLFTAACLYNVWMYVFTYTRFQGKVWEKDTFLERIPDALS